MIKNEKYKKIPISFSTNIDNFNDIIKVVKDSYWIVTDHECLLFYNNSPMCNKNESIAERGSKNYLIPYKTYVKFIKCVFMDIDINDYCW